MAYEKGTASGYVDFYNKLYSFLTSNADLVAADQHWSLAWGTAPPLSGTPSGQETDLVLRGPGLAGNDAVFVAMRLFRDADDDVHGIYMRSCDSVLPSAAAYDEHVNASSWVWTPLFDDTMTYWFIANGRRFIAVAKLSTVYEAMYGGLFKPFSPPSGYPYPVCVGGSSATFLRYSIADYRHTHFVDPGPRDGTADDASSTNSTGGESLIVREPGGAWQKFTNLDGQGTGKTYPWATANFTSDNFLERCTPLLGGGYLLTPVTLTIDVDSVRGALGVLDGVYHVAGYGNAAENIITLNGQDYLVVQNVYRTDLEGYWALKLE